MPSILRAHCELQRDSYYIWENLRGKLNSIGNFCTFYDFKKKTFLHQIEVEPSIAISSLIWLLDLEYILLEFSFRLQPFSTFVSKTGTKPKAKSLQITMQNNALNFGELDWEN